MNIPKLNKKEKTLLIVFVAIVFVAIYYRNFYLPTFKKSQALQLQLQQLARQAEDIQSQFPDLNMEKEKYDATQKEIRDLKVKVSGLEEKLLDPNRLPELIKDITQPMLEEYNVEFISLKPVELKEKRIYDSLDYELILRAEFVDTIKYLRRIKDIFPGLRVNSVRLTTPEKENSFRTEVKIGISILIGKPGGIEKINFSKNANQPGETSTPFFSTEKINLLRSSVSASMKLNGIILNGNNSIAIIDNETVKLNGIFKGKKLVEVKPESVTLEQGGTLYELKLE